MGQHGENADRVSRRGFFERMVVAIGGAFTILIAVPLVGYLFAPFAVARQRQFVRVCSLNEIDSLTPKEFPVSFTRVDSYAPYQEIRGVFVIRRGAEVLAFSNVCTHMECSVRWIDWRQQILCPCHGGLYDRWGQLMGGPPAHSLPLYVTKIENGDLYVSDETVFRI